MDSFEEVKNKIKRIVERYEQLFSAEFANFVNGMKVKRETSKTFAQIGSGDNFIIRALYEVPETLFEMLQKDLTVEELKYLRSSDGGLWFAKSFPLYRSAEKV